MLSGTPNQYGPVRPERSSPSRTFPTAYVAGGFIARSERGGGGAELLDTRTSLQDDVFMSSEDRRFYRMCRY